MNERYEEVEKFIGILEKIGTDSFFFIYIDEKRPNHRIKKSIYLYLANSFGFEGFTEYQIKKAYKELEINEQEKLFSKLIDYLKSHFLDYEREKIQLISKNQLKVEIECWEKLAKIHEYDYSEPRILKSGQECHYFENKNISGIVRDHNLKIEIVLWHKKDYKTRLTLFGFSLIEEYCKDNETPYEFIVRVIDKINKENKFVEFVWDKDEE